MPVTRIIVPSARGHPGISGVREVLGMQFAVDPH
jgi:hypothetical protein